MKILKIIASTETGRRHGGFSEYILSISDGTTITVYASPRLHITRVVRSSPNLKEIEENKIDKIYYYKNRCYRFIPDAPVVCG